MIAVLSENGFMDNEVKFLLMLDLEFQKDVAIEHTKSICDYFGVANKSDDKVDMTKPKTASKKVNLK
ncbi:hypothetical protein [Saliterribacillus persicus]|uniref:Uncharacterized protein n=1 Tax=Saliterribacillus persicus TaxID=930114 RepID=A0A368XT12_9BACI|nr:hypothetical protein DFR57_10616 [Saliterribacillus persicus]